MAARRRTSAMTPSRRRRAPGRHADPARRPGARARRANTRRQQILERINGLFRLPRRRRAAHPAGAAHARRAKSDARAARGRPSPAPRPELAGIADERLRSALAAARSRACMARGRALSGRAARSPDYPSFTWHCRPFLPYCRRRRCYRYRTEAEIRPADRRRPTDNKERARVRIEDLVPPGQPSRRTLLLSLGVARHRRCHRRSQRFPSRRETKGPSEVPVDELMKPGPICRISRSARPTPRSRSSNTRP